MRKLVDRCSEIVGSQYHASNFCGSEARLEDVRQLTEVGRLISSYMYMATLLLVPFVPKNMSIFVAPRPSVINIYRSSSPR